MRQLIPPSLKSVRKSSPPNVSRSPPRQDTVQELLVTTPRLSLLELLLHLSELFPMVASHLDMDHPMDLMEALHTAKGKLRQMLNQRLRLKVLTTVTLPAFRSQHPFVRAFHKRCATRFPSINPGKSRMLFVRLLLISKSLRTAKRLLPPTVNKPLKRFLTILLLLDMIQELAPLLLWTAMPLVIVMVLEESVALEATANINQIL